MNLTLRHFFSQSGFRLNVLKSVTGTSLAQAINVAFAPVLTRIYAPDDYGILALFISMSTIFSLIMSLNYEMGIMLPEDESEAWTLCIFTVILALIGSSFLYVLIKAYGPVFCKVTGFSYFAPYLPWIPFMALLLTANRCAEMWLSRKLRYSLIAGSKLTASGSGALTKLGLGLGLNTGPYGLIAGTLVCEVGKILSILVTPKVRGNARFLFNSCASLLRAYSNFPRYQLGASLLEFAGNAMPVFVLALTFGTATVGFYDLGFRMVFVPVELVVQSVRQVFYQKSVEDLRKRGTVAQLVEATSTRIAALAIIPFSCLGIFGSLLFSAIFGEHWSVAGMYTQILSPAFFLRCVAIPVLVFNTFNYQHLYLKWQLIHFAVMSMALAAGSVFKHDLLSVILLSAGMCGTYLFLIHLNCRVAGASHRNILSGIAHCLRFTYNLPKKQRQ